ncbi:hypothetical protein SteCoe_21731 [Stentor coeruleus]|uniref:Cyclic nucleotide-binding domain-containing protein n=1 Tax=Stentor coeruleus TaxID=5963 RepID=A0A1R2BNW3_9CILI|nr:hypothetical protein SteCoe_21731 [Stentor coeruleus]
MFRLKEINLKDLAATFNDSIIEDFTLSYEQNQLGNHEKALAKYISLLTLQKQMFEIFNNIGVTYYYLKKPIFSIEYFKKAISLNRCSYIPYYNWALVSINLHHYKNAILIIEDAYTSIRNPPSDLIDLMNHAKTQAFSKKGEKLDNFSSEISPTHYSSLSPSKSKKSIRKYISSSHLKYQIPESTINISPSKQTIPSVDRILSPVTKIQTFTNFGKKKRLKVKLESKDSPLPQKPFSFYPRSHYRTLLNLNEVDQLYQIEASNIPGIEKMFESSNETRKNVNHISKIQQYVSDENNVKIEFEDPQKLSTNNLTEQELKYIVHQFDFPDFIRDYVEIDKILYKLYFFLKFNYKVRKSIYTISQIKHYYSGEVIFKQGEIGDKLYVILKGSVSIEKEYPEFRNYSFIINSVYDGRQFGDLSLMGSLNNHPVNERVASCIASEESYFLSIPKKDYQRMLLDSQKEEIESRINFFSEIAIFKGFSLAVLITLATNVELTVFKLDEIIIEQGKFPKGLYIIYSGFAVLYTQGYRIHDRSYNEFLNRRKQQGSVSPINNPKYQKKYQLTPIKRDLYSSIDSFQPEQMSKIQRSLSKSDLKKLKKNKNSQYLVRDSLEFATIRATDYFGGRVLLHNDLAPELASKFTIVAKNSEVKIFIIEKQHLQYFSDDLVHQMKVILSKSFEIDCPPDVNSEQMIKTLHNWQAYRDNLIDGINRNKYLERYKDTFPFNRE